MQNQFKIKLSSEHCRQLSDSKMDLYFIFKKLIYPHPRMCLFIYLERKGERERVRETWCESETFIGCLSHAPQLGMEPATFGVQDNAPIKWAIWPGLDLHFKIQHLIIQKREIFINYLNFQKQNNVLNFWENTTQFLPFI